MSGDIHMRFYLPFFLLLTLTTARAQLNPNNLPNAASHVVNALFFTLKKDSVSKDAISGSCEYRGGTCNGTEVTLLKDGEIIYSTTMTSRGEFHIPKLKLNESYQLLLSLKKYGLKEKRNVSSGDFISIKLLDQ